MAKRTTKSGGTSKVRFIMLEAEMPEGDLSQITAAIQNALKPVSQGEGIRIARQPQKTLSSNDQDGDDIDHLELDEDEFVEEQQATTPPSKPRKPTKRKVLDIDLDSELAFLDFVEQHPPISDQDKYLVCLAFFTDHREDIEGATADHVYTCFRKADWSTGKTDFAQPLRNLKKLQLIDSGSGRGTYEINHIGRDKVRKLAGD